MAFKRWYKWFERFRLAGDGSVGVEFVLSLFFLIPIMFGIIEIGRVVHDYHLVTESVRDAGRYLGRAPLSCTGTPGCGQCTFTASDIARAKFIAMNGVPTAGTPLLGYWTDPNTITIEVCAIDNTNFSPDLPVAQGLFLGLDVVPHVKLSADVPFDFLFGTLVVPATGFELGHFYDGIVTEVPCIGC